jgi:hypothetical protein
LLTTNHRADKNNPLQKVSRERETLFARIEVEPELINIYGKKSVENLLITLFEKLQN